MKTSILDLGIYVSFVILLDVCTGFGWIIALGTLHKKECFMRKNYAETPSGACRTYADLVVIFD